ncbi:MAG: DUF6702 family protein [Bacteroidota bacterium]
MLRWMAICSFACLLSATPAHKFYVSMCQVDHNAQTQGLEVTLKLFTDDLEYALEQRHGEPLRLGTASENPETDRILVTYLRERLALKINDEPATFAFVGKEQEDDITWCYVEVTGQPSLASLEIRNQLLTDYFPDQTNILQVRVGGKSYSGVQRNGSPAESWQFPQSD